MLNGQDQPRIILIVCWAIIADRDIAIIKKNMMYMENGKGT